MPRFELEKLTSYDDHSMIGEIKRVAALIPNGKLKSSDYDKLSKVHSTTLRRRFGDWRKALAAADLEHRFYDRNEAWTKEEIIDELKSIAFEKGRDYVTAEELAEHSGITARPVHRIFGSHKNALAAAGLSQSPMSARYNDEECFENLLQVWTALGRQPSYDEIKRPPSRVGAKAYVGRWGSWRKALAAFVERVNRDAEGQIETPATPNSQSIPEIKAKQTSRSVPLGLRYAVLRRDHFRCVLCGKSPATHHGAVLHVDHFLAWSQGGETILENLRSLCSDCNLGKGAKNE